MKRLILSAAAALALGACAEGYARGPGPVVAYDAYYDGGYGAFYDGYWGDDGGYYYTTGEGRPYVRDDGRHFRRDQATGFTVVHMRAGPHEGAPHYARDRASAGGDIGVSPPAVSAPGAGVRVGGAVGGAVGGVGARTP